MVFKDFKVPSGFMVLKPLHSIYDTAALNTKLLDPAFQHAKTVSQNHWAYTVHVTDKDTSILTPCFLCHLSQNVLPFFYNGPPKQLVSMQRVFFSDEMHMQLFWHYAFHTRPKCMLWKMDMSIPHWPMDQACIKMPHRHSQCLFLPGSSPCPPFICLARHTLIWQTAA